MLKFKVISALQSKFSFIHKCVLSYICIFLIGMNFKCEQCFQYSRFYGSMCHGQVCFRLYKLFRDGFWATWYTSKDQWFKAKHADWKLGWEMMTNLPSFCIGGLENILGTTLQMFSITLTILSSLKYLF